MKKYQKFLHFVSFNQAISGQILKIAKFLHLSVKFKYIIILVIKRIVSLFKIF